MINTFFYSSLEDTLSSVFHSSKVLSAIFSLNLNEKFLYLLMISIVNNALFKILFVPVILLKILVYQANSKTDLTDDHALRPVPGFAGTSFIRAALYFFCYWIRNCSICSNLYLYDIFVGIMSSFWYSRLYIISLCNTQADLSVFITNKHGSTETQLSSSGSNSCYSPHLKHFFLKLLFSFCLSSRSSFSFISIVSFFSSRRSSPFIELMRVLRLLCLFISRRDNVCLRRQRSLWLINRIGSFYHLLILFQLLSHK